MDKGRVKELSDSLGRLASRLAEAVSYEEGIGYSIDVPEEGYLVINLFPRTPRAASVIIGKGGNIVRQIAGIVKIQAATMEKGLNAQMPRQVRINVVMPENGRKMNNGL